MIIVLSCLRGVILHAEDKAAASYDGPKEKLHVYLLIGQSNMAGRAPFTEEEAEVIDHCHLLNDQDKWEPAKNPLNRYSTIRKSLSIQKMSPGYGFSQAISTMNKGITIGLVVNAKGGTRIEQWGKSTPFYKEALRRTQEAQKTGTLKGILWHQGESDSGNPDGYLTKLTDLIMNLRKDFDMPDLPFVAGKVYYHPDKKPHTKQINDQIAQLPDTVRFTGYVESEDLTTLDNTHFDSEGMKLLGQRYAMEMMKIQAMVIAEQKPAP